MLLIRFIVYMEREDMQDKVQIQAVLDRWDLKNPSIEKQLQEKSPRLIFKIKTDSGCFVLKGYPCKTPEDTIKSNVQAHLFLGKEKGLAPRVYPLKTGQYYTCDQGYWFYLMEFIEGRQMEETPEDEYRIGQAARELHKLQGYNRVSPDSQSKKRFYEWFRDKPFVKEYDAILDEIPDFEKLEQCFVHTDIGPHNTMLSQEGKVVFIDLDDTGIGSRYLDIGWPFIMQFVDYNQDTEEMHYRFDLAKSFLKGYYGEKNITRKEYDLLFYGAEQMHISYMQSYGPYAVDSLWMILKYGMSQKETLWDMIHR